MSLHKRRPQQGFTVIETLAAILVLTIGLFGMAALMSNMMTSGAHSRYMPTADTLIYNRRWTIEKDSPVVGVRRITVLVTLTNPVVVKSVTFQRPRAT